MGRGVPEPIWAGHSPEPTWSPPTTTDTLGGPAEVELIEKTTPYDGYFRIEQFRIVAYAAGPAPRLIEPVAGSVEPGETPEDVARREALEEAGCVIAELEPIGTVLSTPGGCSEVLIPSLGDNDP